MVICKVFIMFRLAENGNLAKILLDSLRVKRLRSIGFTSKIIEYIDHNVSPENKAILAIKDL